MIHRPYSLTATIALNKVCRLFGKGTMKNTNIPEKNKGTKGVNNLDGTCNHLPCIYNSLGPQVGPINDPFSFKSNW